MKRDSERPVWEEVGLTEEEYREICEHMGRHPNFVELGIYGLMWSEHCSYKSSRLHLEKLPTTGDKILQGPGENAGIVEIDDGVAAAFRIESHNHPSAIEPMQGAATGVGGILRDIMAVGATPAGLLNSLRFGKPDESHVRHLFEGVVSGISYYGNCMGIPTVGGEVYFHDAYRKNPLVNVMCVGLMPTERVTEGTAYGPGNPVYIVGARTGRDGIHGASLLASQELTSESDDMRPAVQVGDPFCEKLLMQACQELLESEAVVGMNDLGAAGLASAASETASRAETGIAMDVQLVPRRESGMTPYEVVLSESQERMLIIVQQGYQKQVEEIFARWELDAAQIGVVTEEQTLCIKEGSKTVAELPVKSLTRGAPKYDRPVQTPSVTWDPVNTEDVPIPKNLDEVLLKMISHPNLCSRSPIYEKFDHMVGIDTVLHPGSDAALLRIKGSKKGLAAVTDGNGLLCHLDARRGAMHIVTESYRNICAVGGEPLAMTNCLNFANPERPGVMHAFVQVIEGMKTACEQLNTPVTGGNVSFYNETDEQGIYPTPVIGMIGSVTDISCSPKKGFKNEGDLIYLLGDGHPRLDGSHYLHIIHDQVVGVLGDIDFSTEKMNGTLCQTAIMDSMVSSVSDISDGGLAVALAECAIASEKQLGCQVHIESDLREDELLFGKGGPGYLITVPVEKSGQLETLADRLGCSMTQLGTVGSEKVRIFVNESLLIDAEVRKVDEASASVLK